MHSTEATKKRASLSLEAKKLEKEARTLAKVGQMGPAARTRLIGSRLRLKPSRTRARLEDLHIWQMKKVKGTKKGDGTKTTYTYWMAS